MIRVANTSWPGMKGATGKQRWEIDLSMNPDVGGLFIDPGGKTVASWLGHLSASGLIDIATGRIQQSAGIGVGCVSLEGNYCVAAGQPHGQALYRIGDVAPLVTMGRDDHAGRCYQLEFSRDGRQFAWPKQAGVICVTDLEEVRRQLDRLGMGWKVEMR